MVLETIKTLDVEAIKLLECTVKLAAHLEIIKKPFSVQPMF